MFEDTTDTSPVNIGLLDLFMSTTFVFVLISASLWRVAVDERHHATAAAASAAQDRAALASRLREEQARNAEYARQLAVMSAEVERHRARTIIIPNELNGKVLFDPGEATIRPAFHALLTSYAEQLLAAFNDGSFDSAIVAGHTDDRAIHTWQYADNWALGAGRAAAVVRYLVARGVPAERLSAVSYGEFKPLAAGHDEGAWRLNRRIEIVLLRREGGN